MQLEFQALAWRTRQRPQAELEQRVEDASYLAWSRLETERSKRVTNLDERLFNLSQVRIGFGNACSESSGVSKNLLADFEQCRRF
jgi:hypothetical protein